MMQPKKTRTVNSENRFSKAPPGYSLTGTPGKWPWERPPEINTPAEAVDSVIENIEQEEARVEYLQLMAAGVSIEELVGTISRVGFMEGKWSADVAEIIKAPLAIYLMGMATEHDIPALVFTTPDGFPRKNYGMKDTQILNIMKDRNPEFAQFINKNAQLGHRIEAQATKKMREVEQGSFMGVELDPQMQEEMPEAPVEGDVEE